MAVTNTLRLVFGVDGEERSVSFSFPHAREDLADIEVTDAMTAILSNKEAFVDALDRSVSAELVSRSTREFTLV